MTHTVLILALLALGNPLSPAPRELPQPALFSQGGLPACGAGPDEVLLARSEPPIGPAGVCTATADCGSYPDVSCSGSGSSSTCTYEDRNCFIEQQGYVQCDGSVTYCPPCCEPGQIRNIELSDCCKPGLRKMRQEYCNSDGQWVFSYIWCNPIGCLIEP